MADKNDGEGTVAKVRGLVAYLMGAGRLGELAGAILVQSNQTRQL